MSMHDRNEDKPINLRLRILNRLQRIIVIVSRYLFRLYYNSEKCTVPVIRTPVITESVSTLAEMIRKRKITCEELVSNYIERIKEADYQLQAFVEGRFRYALEEARAVDRLLIEGNVSVETLAKEKPLLGVPFTTKDCIAVKGLGNTSGLVSRKKIVSQTDAAAIGLLRKAGAIPLGLTNVSELCMWWESHNRVHGRTRNPYDNTRIVGGSSGGEGCIQAIAGSAFGIGSDIGGSIRMPCFFNGVFGHKPTKFAVSNEGQYPAPKSTYQMSFLSTGPITRKAKDLKPILKIISEDYAQKLNLDEPVDLSNLKVFYQIDNGAPLVCPVDEEIRECMIDAIKHLEKKFNVKAEQVKINKLAKSAPIWLSNMQVLDAPPFGELLTGSNKFSDVIFELLKCLFGRSNNTFIGIITALVDRLGVQAGSPKYKKYYQQRQQLEDEFKSLLGVNGVFLYPTHPTPALYHNEPLFRSMNFCYTAIINCLGFPATHIPMGLSKREHLPIGFQVVSNFDNDRLCLAIAEELDREFECWIEPNHFNHVR